MSKHSGFNLSNVDMLACGLGACILLMLAFIVNINGTGSSKGLSSGNKNNIAMAALLSSNEIKEGKMVFVRSVEIKFPEIDFNEINMSLTNTNFGEWLYDGKNINEIEYVEQQIFFNEKNLTYTYLIKSDSILPNRITYRIEGLLKGKTQTFGKKGEGYSINAKLLEGAMKDSENEEIFNGVYVKSLQLNNLSDIKSVEFLRKVVDGNASLGSLIEFYPKQ